MLISPARRLSWSSISGAKRRFSIQKRCRKVDTQEGIQVCWIASASWSGYRFKRKRPDGARAASIFTKLHQMVMELWEMLRKNFLSTTNCKLKANKDMKIDEENMNTSRLPGLVWEMKRTSSFGLLYMHIHSWEACLRRCCFVRQHTRICGHLNGIIFCWTSDFAICWLVGLGQFPVAATGSNQDKKLA